MNGLCPVARGLKGAGEKKREREKISFGVMAASISHLYVSAQKEPENVTPSLPKKRLDHAAEFSRSPPYNIYTRAHKAIEIAAGDSREHVSLHGR